LEPAEIRIVVDTGPQSDDKELAEATRQLRNMLLGQQVEYVRFETVENAPLLGKSADLPALGVLLVAMAPAVFGAVTATVKTWSERQTGRSAKVTLDGNSLELTGISEKQTQQIIEEFWLRTERERRQDGPDGSA
jgi:hypothetical protein